MTASPRRSPKLKYMLLSAAAGVMLAAVFLALILPALDTAGERPGDDVSASLPDSLPFIAGAATVEYPSSGLPPEALPGGDTTFLTRSPLSPHGLDVLGQPTANLGSDDRMQFAVGNSFFTNPWVTAGASTTGRDGLGPLFNAAACQDCHIRDGRGHAPGGPQDALTSAVVRIALPDGSPDPVYGTHVQTRSVPGLPAEARVSVAWEARTVTLPDGTSVELRKPSIRLTDWGYGAPHPDLRAGLRVAPSMTGMGLLQAVPATDLRAYAKAQQADGLRGIAQTATDHQGEELLGRFGWKATQPTVRQQVLDAFVNDIGITSSLFGDEICTPEQLRQGCADQPSGGQPELTPAIETAIVVYAQHLAPPVRRGYDDPDVRAGQALFAEIGCQGCHKPGWITGRSAVSPVLSEQRIWPYTDLLLHDMGPGLADGIVEGHASGQHWRTPPLWALGQVKAVGGDQAGYLHDGRARTLAEAILWHGGEAQAARDAWAALPQSRRRQVLSFLNSL